MYRKTKNNEYNESKDFVDLLGLIPINYKGDMIIFNNLIIEIKKQYPTFCDFIDNYFVKNKKQYFINGNYNYFNIPKDCRSNSYLENYNLYLKQNLGRKYNLNWNVSINFLKKEFARIKDKLTNNTNNNFLIKSKKTKFNTENYNEKQFSYNIIKNNKIIKNFRWLSYNENSCRYDVFIAFYTFYIFDFMSKNYLLLNFRLKEIHDIISEIKKKPILEKRNMFWKYCIDKKIDILETEINDSNIIINNDFGINGFIIQLFSIFKNIEYFCIKEKRLELCQICSRTKEFSETFNTHLITINENNIKLSNIESILTYSLIFDGLTKCDFCNFDDNLLTCRISYEIVEYPKFLFVIFDLGSYEIILNNAFYIKKLLVDRISFTKNDNYYLKGIITAPYHNHFTFYINHLNIESNLGDLELNKNYYYDDLQFNGCFQELDGIDSLYNYENTMILPYIVIYEKI